MPSVRTFQASFNGGVVSPEFWGRVDDQKYQMGVATADNLIVLPHGPLTNCPGTQFVSPAKIAAKRARLIPFTYSTVQTQVLELGEGYIRFHSQGQTVLTPAGSAAWSSTTTYAQGDLVTSGGATWYSRQGGNLNHGPAAGAYWYELGTYYEIPAPYAEGDLFAITHVQSADVLTLCHTGYPPMELRRYGATNWQLVAISFGNVLAQPTISSVDVVRGDPASTATKSYSYVVTAASTDGKSESAQSDVGVGSSQNLTDSGAYNTVNFGVLAGIDRYHVYRLSGGLYGFMGAVTTGTSFQDDGSIIPDTGNTPPIAQYPFNTDYPGAVSYFEQRRMFAGTPLFPQKLWGTRSGSESDLAYSIPSRDDDAISFKIAARDVNTIRHIVPMESVILLTSGGVWRLASSDGGAITPSTISVKPQSGVGANSAQPVIDDTTALYISARGGHIRELGYSWQTQGFVSSDLSLRAPNLFDGYDITQLAFQRAPTPIMWGVSTAGNLIGMTYVPDQDVRALFTRSTTNGVIESVCCVAEGIEDRIYVLVRRVIGGQTVRYVERMAERLWATPADAVFVDCAGSYSGAETSTVTGLTWLEGETVSILADGAVMPQKVVTDGAITLDEPASVVQVGLPIVTQMQTLPATLLQSPGAGQGRPKNANRIFFRVKATGGLKAGPDVNNLVEAKVRTTESPGSPPDLVTDEIEIVPFPSWSNGGQIVVYHDDPLPMTLLSMVAEFSVGS